MSESGKIEVRAFWDEEAGVYVAESEQVPGLVTEAETVELLAAKLESLIPELLELNGSGLSNAHSASVVFRREVPLHAA